MKQLAGIQLTTIVPYTVVVKHVVVQLDLGPESDSLFLWIEVDSSVGEIDGKDRA